MPWFCLLSFIGLCNFVYLKHWNHLVSNGSFLSASYYLRDSWVLAAFYGGKLHFQGHNLTAQRNLLINDNFLINQRGQTTYAGAGYTVDGWYNSNAACSVSLLNGFLRYHCTGNYSFLQRIESPESFSSKIVTLTVNGRSSLSGFGSFGLRIVRNGAQIFGQLVRLNTTFSTVSKTYMLPEISSSDSLQIYATSGSSEMLDIDLVNVKLEMGGNFTGFTTPDPVLELARCQRYLQVYTKRALFPRYIAAVGCGFGMPIPKMRVKPAVLFKGTLNTDYGVKVSDARITVNSIHSDGLTTNEWLDIWTTLPAGSSTPTHPLLWFEGDSQLILSAEL